MNDHSNPVLFHVHVPKCAGTSVDRVALAGLSAGESWITERRHWKRPVSKVPIDAQKLRYVSGHFVGKSVENFLNGRPIKRTALLREPVSFYLYYYNYRMMRYIKSGLRPYNIDMHVQSQPENPITHFLLFRWLEMPWRKLVFYLRKINTISSTKNFPAFGMLLTTRIVTS